MKPIIIFLSIFSILILSVGCSPANTEPTPTPVDPVVISTNAAATVWAEVTQIIALTPTLAPTALPATPEPPTATATKPAVPATKVQLPDMAQWVSQTIEDSAKMKPGQVFNITFKIKNVGTTTWNTNYRLSFLGGEPLGAPQFIAVRRDIKPGEVADFTLRMTAPTSRGNIRTDWIMKNANGATFPDSVYLSFLVE